MGSGYFPSELVNVVHGRFPLPQEAGLISNCDGPIDPRNNSTPTGNSTYAVSLGSEEFNASVTGRNAVNYLCASVCVLWNAFFLEAKLGMADYNATFGGPPNFVIVRGAINR